MFYCERYDCPKDANGYCEFCWREIEEAEAEKRKLDKEKHKDSPLLKEWINFPPFKK